MKILPAFSILQPSSHPNTKIVDVGGAVGFCFNVSALPAPLICKSDYGSRLVKRGEIIPLRTSSEYVFEIEDTFSGDVQTDTYAQINDFWNDYPRNAFSRKMDGTIPITIFDTVEEMQSWRPASPYQILIAPAIEDIHVSAERWRLFNIDYSRCETFLHAASGGYWGSFILYEGQDIATVGDWVKFGGLAAIGFDDTDAVSQFETGRVVVSNTNSIGLVVRETNASLSSHRAYWIMRFFESKTESPKVEGISSLFGIFNVVAVTTGQTKNIVVPPMSNYNTSPQWGLYNSHASANLANVSLQRRRIFFDGNVAANSTSSIIASATLNALTLKTAAGGNPEFAAQIVADGHATEVVTLLYTFHIGHS